MSLDELETIKKLLPLIEDAKQEIQAEDDLVKLLDQ